MSDPVGPSFWGQEGMLHVTGALIFTPKLTFSWAALAAGLAVASPQHPQARPRSVLSLELWTLRRGICAAPRALLPPPLPPSSVWAAVASLFPTTIHLRQVLRLVEHPFHL